MARLVFSSHDLDPRLTAQHRARAWSESLMAGGYNGHPIIPETDDGFYGVTDVRLSGPSMICRCASSSLIVRREPAHIARDLDDRVMIFFNAGTVKVNTLHLGRSTDLAPGEAVLLTQENPQAFDASKSGAALGLILPREAIDHWRREAHDLAGHRHDYTSPVFRMMRTYCQLLADDGEVLSPEQGEMMRRHVVDLLGQWLGAGDAGRTSSEDASLSARFTAIRRLMRRQSADPQLDIASVARQMGLSSRMVQHVLTVSGTSFSVLLNRLRCTRAAVMLADPAYANTRLPDLALACGYADYSHFFRAFRRHSGAAPSDLRP